MEDALQRLLDKSDVSETVRRYFLALDRFDWAAVAGLVADEFMLEADAPGAEPRPVPREEFIRTLIARNGGFTGTLHINPDHVVTIDGDRAHVSAHMWAAHMVGQAPKDGFWGYGLYEIDLARQADGRWQLVSQRIDIVGVGGEGTPADIFGRAMERQQAGDGHY
jgi:SnoaL-like domain